MLTRSFAFTKGITDELERTLWGRGITTWDTLRKHSGQAGDVLGEGRTRKLIQAVSDADEARKSCNMAWFCEHWPRKEMWRLWNGFCSDEERALVDIETTGRTPGYDQITVIGLSNGTEEHAFVADIPQTGDRPLAMYPEAIKKYKIMVTFNGESFDLPFIEKHFRSQNYKTEQPHIDIMYTARSVGLTGGLKDMEKTVGITRDSEIADIRGNDAITMWGAWKNGDAQAYDKLITYCKADCTNLKAFTDAIYQMKVDKIYTPYANDIDLDKTMGEQLSLF